MKIFFYYFSILCTIFATGCLQEQAEIDGVKNYYLPPETKISVNREGYSGLKTENLATRTPDENYIFEDEIENIAKQKKNAIDPYTKNINDNYDINFNVDSDILQNHEGKKNIDWDNIFSDNKKTSDSNIIKNNNNILQDQKKDNKSLVAKREVNSSKNEVNQKQNSNIPIIKRTSKVEDKQEKDKRNVFEKKDANKIPLNNDTFFIKRPTQGIILSKYGKSGDSELDDGMTFKVTDKNIISAGDGKVIYIDGEGSSRKTVIIKHNNGLIVSYSYNGDVKTALNREVKTGQSIGNVSTDKNILYFTVRNKGKTIDPESIIK